MTREELVQATMLAMTRQNVDPGGGRYSSIFSPRLKYLIQDDRNQPSIELNDDGTAYLTKPGAWNGYYCFANRIPRHARRLIIHMAVTDITNPNTHSVSVGWRGDYDVSNPSPPLTNVIAYVTNRDMTVEELMSQTRIKSLDLSNNVSLDEQDVVLDISHIHEDVYLVMRTANQVLYLYNIYTE